MDSSFDRTTQAEDWLTPPALIKALGPFDLDPCAPVNRPWDTAAKHLTRIDDGLKQTWEGFVWCNPPYGKETGRWIARLAEHGNGIGLVFARTDTALWHDVIFPKAYAILFLKGRLKFFTVEGKEAGPAGAPSALVAFGGIAERNLINNKRLGHLVITSGIGREIGK